MAIVGSRIKERRKAVGLSVDKLAALIGKDRSTIYRYESDEIENFPINVIPELADALLTTPAYLMGWTDDPSLTAEEPAPKSEPVIQELIQHFEALSANEQQQILGLVRMLSEAHGDTQAHKD